MQLNLPCAHVGDNTPKLIPLTAPARIVTLKKYPNTFNQRLLPKEISLSNLKRDGNITVGHRRGSYRNQDCSEFGEPDDPQDTFWYCETVNHSTEVG